jgi:DNA-binding transcriptional LysR family regulator
MLDPVQLESFLAVAQTRNFTEAGRRLGLRQSTVSQHISKLEQASGRRLFVRDTHSVVPTADGEAMTGFAQSILDANARARDYFAGSQVRGRVRFGTSEDFVSSRLPELLREFVRRHALVDLELTVGLSATLYEQLDAGDLDLVLAKRRAGDEWGRLVWRDRLAWIGAPGTRVDPARPVPLILYTPPSITRAVALEALERVGRARRIVCTSGSLSGVRAAALAGLGITLHAFGLMPDGLVEVPGTARLPPAGDVEFVVQTGRLGSRGPAAELAQAILTNGDRLQRYYSCRDRNVCQTPGRTRLPAWASLTGRVSV